MSSDSAPNLGKEAGRGLSSCQLPKLGGGPKSARRFRCLVLQQQPSSLPRQKGHILLAFPTSQGDPHPAFCPLQCDATPLLWVGGKGARVWWASCHHARIQGRTPAEDGKESRVFFPAVADVKGYPVPKGWEEKIRLGGYGRPAAAALL